MRPAPAGGGGQRTPPLSTSANARGGQAVARSLAALSEVDETFLVTMIRIGKLHKIASIAKHMDMTTDYAQKYREHPIEASIIRASGRRTSVSAVPYLTDHLARIA